MENEKDLRDGIRPRHVSLSEVARCRLSALVMVPLPQGEGSLRDFFILGAGGRLQPRWDFFDGGIKGTFKAATSKHLPNVSQEATGFLYLGESGRRKSTLAFTLAGVYLCKNFQANPAGSNFERAEDIYLGCKGPKIEPVIIQRRGLSCGLVSEPRWFSQLQEAPKGETGYLWDKMKPDILVIDDVGRNVGYPDKTQQTWEEIFDIRLRKGNVTFFTTNLDQTHLEKTFGERGTTRFRQIVKQNSFYLEGPNFRTYA